MHPLIQQIFAPFLAPKTAKQIQQIDLSDCKIWVEDWSLKYDWFTVYLYRSTWPTNVECFKKEFMPWEFDEYVQEEHGAPGNVEEWFNCMSIPQQRAYVEGFVRIHDATLQVELDYYYANIKQSK